MYVPPLYMPKTYSRSFDKKCKSEPIFKNCLRRFRTFKMQWDDNVVFSGAVSENGYIEKGGLSEPEF